MCKLEAVNKYDNRLSKISFDVIIRLVETQEIWRHWLLNWLVFNNQRILLYRQYEKESNAHSTSPFSCFSFSVVSLSLLRSSSWRPLSASRADRKSAEDLGPTNNFYCCCCQFLTVIFILRSICGKFEEVPAIKTSLCPLITRPIPREEEVVIHRPLLEVMEALPLLPHWQTVQTWQRSLLAFSVWLWKSWGPFWTMRNSAIALSKA